MSWLSLGLGYILLYAIAIVALADFPLVRAWLGPLASLAAAGAVIGVVYRRRREWAGCQRLFWLAFAVGMGTWIAGHIGWIYGSLIAGHDQYWINWHTVFSFCGGAAPLIALLARPHRGARRNAYAVTAIDIATVAVVVGFVVTYFILIPHIDPAAAEAGWTSLLVLAQAQRLLMLTGMVAAAVVARGLPWAATYWRLAGALFLGNVLRAVLNVALEQGTYDQGSLLDLAWIVPYIGYAWAAAEAPASDLSESKALERPASQPWLITGAVATVPLIGYGVHFVWPLSQTVDAARVLGTTLTIVVGLALVTIRMIVQRTELRRADERVRLLAAVTEHTKDLVLIVTADGGFEDANDEFLDATGYSRKELAGTSLTDLLASGMSRVRREIGQAVAAGGVWRGTLVRRRKDGTTFPAACTVVAIRDEVGEVTHFVGVERDISDEMKMREQLIHTERLAAMTEVVAGVAHEVNNPLQAILGCTELLLENTQGEVRRDLEIVRGEAIRAGQIVRNLLSFVRRGTGERCPLDLNEIVQSTVALRAYHLQQVGTALDVVCHGEPLPVNGNQEELRQALLNLLLNAEHAIKSSGHGSRIAVSTWADPRGATVQVSDDGPGIPLAHRRRIFEPFFTTKDVGEGTGLGLSIALGIALSHGGTLEFAPGPTGGASFRLILPRWLEQARGLTLETEGGPRDVPRSALVIEDDEAIRVLLTRLLERRGYRVAQAADGRGGLEALDRVIPDLVICDVRMPRLSGPEFHAEAVRMHPELARRFLLMTGDTARGDAEAFARDAGIPLLHKPFSAADLDTVLRALAATSHHT
jgi:PAS domain S-box-containing protein